MSLDHRIQEILLDGSKSTTDIFRALGPLGAARTWSTDHLEQRLYELVRRDRVTRRHGGLWALECDGVAWIPERQPSNA